MSVPIIAEKAVIIAAKDAGGNAQVDALDVMILAMDAMGAVRIIAITAVLVGAKARAKEDVMTTAIATALEPVQIHVPAHAREDALIAMDALEDAMVLAVLHVSILVLACAIKPVQIAQLRAILAVEMHAKPDALILVLSYAAEHVIQTATPIA